MENLCTAVQERAELSISVKLTAEAAAIGAEGRTAASLARCDAALMC